MTPASIRRSLTRLATRFFVAGCAYVVLSAPSFAQQQTAAPAAPQKDGAAEQQKDGAAVQQEQPEARRQRRGFVDTDGDGINDRSRRAERERARANTATDASGGNATSADDSVQDARVKDAPGKDEQSARPRRRGRDTFIDSDGDGINDVRSTGTGTGLGTGLRRGGAGRRGR